MIIPYFLAFVEATVSGAKVFATIDRVRLIFSENYQCLRPVVDAAVGDPLATIFFFIFSQ